MTPNKPKSKNGTAFSVTAMLCLGVLISPTGRAQDSENDALSPLQLPEIIKVIRQHLPTISQADLDRAALQGILTEFQSQLEVVSAASGETSSSPSTEASPTPALTRLYDSSLGYLASPLMDPSAPQSVRAGYNQLVNEHIVKGLVVDLRHVSGSGYSILPELVGLFTSQPLPLLDWGEGNQPAAPQSVQIKPPVVVLIDESTQGAGEALAAVLRTTKLGILIGRKTAGEAHRIEEIPLESGQILRLAAGKISLADGQELSSEGVSPDIDVPRSETAPTTAEQQDSPVPGEPLRFPQDDPILARALELLKGINIVEGRNRS